MSGWADDWIICNSKANSEATQITQLMQHCCFMCCYESKPNAPLSIAINILPSGESVNLDTSDLVSKFSATVVCLHKHRRRCSARSRLYVTYPDIKLC